MLIGLGAVVLAAVIGVYFLFLPRISKSKDFVGKTTNEVGVWARENGIDTQNIVLNQVFSMEYDADQDHFTEP